MGLKLQIWDGHQHELSQHSIYNLLLDQAGQRPTSHQGFQALLDLFKNMHSRFFLLLLFCFCIFVFFSHEKITIYNRKSYFNILKRGGK